LLVVITSDEQRNRGFQFGDVKEVGKIHAITPGDLMLLRSLDAKIFHRAILTHIYGLKDATCLRSENVFRKKVPGTFLRKTFSDRKQVAFLITGTFLRKTFSDRKQVASLIKHEKELTSARYAVRVGLLERCRNSSGMIVSGVESTMRTSDVSSAQS